MILKIDKNKIERIHLFPSKKDYSFLCNNETAKKHYLGKKWFVDSKLKQRYVDFNGFADVFDLTLNKNEIIADCASSDSTPNKSCSDDIKQITVLTKALDPDNDVLTYQYYVSGGKIIGTGANVIWDLSGVKAGTYSITAGADDLLCGVCGKTMTQTVVVKECPSCSAK